MVPDYAAGLPPGTWVWAMNKRGVADRSSGLGDCGEGFDAINRPQQWVTDHTDFVRHQLAGLPQPPSAVVLVGVSEGAWVAGRLARDPSLGVTHLVLVGSGAWTMRQIVTALGRGRPWLSVQASLQAVDRQPDRLDLRWWGHPHRWWSNVLDLNPLDDLLAMDVPILAAMGDRDSSVPSEALKALADAFLKAGKNNLLPCLYPGADHTLASAGRQHRADVYQALAHWVQSGTSTAPDPQGLRAVCPTANTP